MSDLPQYPQYKSCPHCGQEMYLSRGYYLCANVQACAFMEPADPANAADPEFLARRRARRKLNQARRTAAGLNLLPY